MKKNLIITAALITLLSVVIMLPPLLHGEDKGPEAIIPAAEEREKPIDLEISAAGDVMIHKPQITAQYDSDTDSYNFDNNFKYIKEYIEGSDLALCNLETTFAGGRYTGYPIFNAPESLAAALKKAGFDVAVTANNHAMDMGLSGMKRTLEIARGEGLHTVGSRLEGEKEYIIVDVKGIKIGIVAYFYETPEIGAIPTINGNEISGEAWPLLSTFNYDTLEEDLLKVEKSINDARTEGAELVICYFHWGEEYQRSPNEYQQYIAQKSVSYGADIIFASHPHVLQGVEMLTDVSGRKVPVFYSMGNFISNQRQETLDNRYTEQGMIAQVQLKFIKSTGTVLSAEAAVIPTWVEKYKKNGKDYYTIIPLNDKLSENPSLAESGHYLRAVQALEDIRGLLGEEYIKTEAWE